MQDKIMKFVKRELKAASVSETPAIGEFEIDGRKPKLFPGSTYGFLAVLTVEELNKLFQEACERGNSNIPDLRTYKQIIENVYPLYWGKDKSIGKRPYEHLKNPKGTGSVRLETYSSLKNKRIFSFAIIVNKEEEFEKHLQNKYPHLLRTTTKQQVTSGFRE